MTIVANHTKKYNIYLFYMIDNKKSEQLLKQYIDIKKRYMSKVGININYSKPIICKPINVKRSIPIKIPVPSSDDDIKD